MTGASAALFDAIRVRRALPAGGSGAEAPPPGDAAGSARAQYAAIARYEKSGYRLFGRHRDYYDDHGDALRFERSLDAARPMAARLAKDRLHPRAT